MSQAINAYAERAMHILRSVEKERDELQYRMEHAAPNDAIRINGPSMLDSYKYKVDQARRMAMDAGAELPAMPVVTENIATQETSRLLRLPRK